MSSDNNSDQNKINNNELYSLDTIDKNTGIIIGFGTGGLKHTAQQKIRNIVDDAYKGYIKGFPGSGLEQEVVRINENQKKRNDNLSFCFVV